MTKTQEKNIAWYLPRPRRNKYKGGMPRYCEEWLIKLAKEILGYDGTVLSLFCGMCKIGFRVDLNPEVKPDLLCDVHELTKYHQKHYDIILADPPYSNEESKYLYGTPKLNYKKWTGEAEKLLKPGGLLIVYHKYIMPNPNPRIFSVVKRVFIGHRIYHIPRVAIYFQKHRREEV